MVHSNGLLFLFVAFQSLLLFSVSQELSVLVNADSLSVFVVVVQIVVRGTVEFVPEGEERLREVSLDTKRLVMNIVVDRVIREEDLERIIWESVSTMVIHSLHGRESEQD